MLAWKNIRKKIQTIFHDLQACRSSGHSCAGPSHLLQAVGSLCMDVDRTIQRGEKCRAADTHAWALHITCTSQSTSHLAHEATINRRGKREGTHPYPWPYPTATRLVASRPLLVASCPAVLQLHFYSSTLPELAGTQREMKPQTHLKVLGWYLTEQ